MRIQEWRNDERGSAMVISLLVLLVLTVLGTMFLVQTNTETQIAGQDQRWTQSLYNAEAGYGEVIARMSDMSDTANYIGRPMGDWLTNPGWGAYVVTVPGASAQDPDAGLAATDGLDNDLDGSVDESGEVYPEVLTKQTGDDIVPYSWAKVRYKLNATNQALLFGDHDMDLTTAPQINLTRGFPVLMVTSEGEQGSSNRIVDIEAVKYPFQTVYAALYCEDDTFIFGGTAFLISGRDWDPDTGTYIATNPEVPAIATTADPDVIASSLMGLQVNNVDGVGTEPAILPSTIDLDLVAMAAEYSALATVVLAPGNYANTTWGSYDDYWIVHCTGDLLLSGQCSGGGILIVDGSMTCTGEFIWYGMIIVLGDIRFTGNGDGVHIYGTVLAQGGLSDQQVQGATDLLFSTAALDRLASLSPYVVSSWREP